MEQVHFLARVVELVDSLDSGSSARYGHAGSTPASRTKALAPFGVPFFVKTGFLWEACFLLS